MAIGFDRVTNWLQIQGTMEEAEIDEAVPKVREALESEDSSLTEKEIRKNIPMRGIIVSKAIRQMFKANELERIGRGKKGDPFRYSMALDLNGHSPNSCPREGVIGGESSGHESKKTTQALDKIAKNACPENLDTNGTRTDTNRKADFMGHESGKLWEEVPR